MINFPVEIIQNIQMLKELIKRFSSYLATADKAMKDKVRVLLTKG